MTEMTEFEKLTKLLIEMKEEMVGIKEEMKDLKKNFKGLVEINQRLIHERLNVPVPPPPKDFGEENKTATKSSAKITISNFGDRIKITGQTYDYRPLIKEVGCAKWEGEIKAWSLPLDSLKTLLEKFKEANMLVDRDIKVDVKESNIKENVIKASAKSKDEEPDEEIETNFDSSSYMFED
jgi:hypothetical protein